LSFADVPTSSINSPERDQLYNLSKDPLENTNIFDTNPKKAKEMKKLLVKKLKSFPNRPYGELVK